MTLEGNKSIVRRIFEELIGRGNLRLLEDLVAPGSSITPRIVQAGNLAEKALDNT